MEAVIRSATPSTIQQLGETLSRRKMPKTRSNTIAREEDESIREKVQLCDRFYHCTDELIHREHATPPCSCMARVSEHHHGALSQDQDDAVRVPYCNYSTLTVPKVFIPSNHLVFLCWWLLTYKPMVVGA